MLIAAGSIPAGANILAETSGGPHGNISQAAADSAGSYAAAARMQAQQNFSLAEWTSLPEGFLTSNLQTLFSNPGARRLLAEGQLQQLRVLAMQRGIALPPAAPTGIAADSSSRGLLLSTG